MAPIPVSISTSVRTETWADSLVRTRRHRSRSNSSGARIKMSRSLSFVAAGRRVASSNPTLPVGPHCNPKSDMIRKTESSCSRGGISSRRLDLPHESRRDSCSGMTRSTIASTARYAAKRCPREFPRTPTGIIARSGEERRVTTQQARSKDAYTHAGGVSSKRRSALPPIRSRSCGKTSLD